MKSFVAHAAVYDGLTDSEIGHLLVELRTGRFTRAAVTIRTVAVSRGPVTTMGGLRVLPDMALSELEPAASDLLILGGAPRPRKRAGRRRGRRRVPGTVLSSQTVR